MQLMQMYGMQQEFPVQSAITRVQEVSAQSKKDRELLRIYGLEDDSIIVDGEPCATAFDLASTVFQDMH